MISSFRSIFRSNFFREFVFTALVANDWFTMGGVDYAVGALEGEFLDDDKFRGFAQRCGVGDFGRRVGVLCAGNLPLVGFGDLFYCLVCGCDVVLRVSSRDPLMRAFGVLPGVELVDGLGDFGGCDGILVMGSDSTCATLRGLYPEVPMLLRGDMHSVGVLDGGESVGELRGLVDDVFVHSGMGCRSVSHLYIPLGYDFSALKMSLESFKMQLSGNWTDSVCYNRAMMSMCGCDFIDFGSILLTPTASTTPSTSPGVLTYSHYSTPPLIDRSRVQFVSKRGTFGTGQRPSLFDFANGQNVIDFLRTL